MKPTTLRLRAASTLAALTLTSAVQATTWTAGTGPWGTAANWDAGVPAAGIAANILNGGTAQITTETALAGLTTLNGASTLTQSGGSLTLNGNIVVQGGGIWNLSSGAFTNANECQIGQGAGNTGTLNMSGGTFAANTYMSIGRGAGTGVVNLSGGTLTKNATNFLIVGDNTGATGTLNISGTGTLTTNGATRIGSATGSNGTIAMTGGNYNANALVSVGLNGTGLINLSAGAITTADADAGEIRVGSGTGSNGTFDMSGGTLSSRSWFVVGQGGGTGVVNLSGGTFTKSNRNTLTIGNDAGAVGTFNINGTGILNLNGTMRIGNAATANATVNISGTGTLNAGAEIQLGHANTTGAATINLSGGGAINSQNWFGIGRGGSGTVNMTGGTINQTVNGSINIGAGGQGSASTGIINHSGGTINSTTRDFVMGDGDNRNGTYTISGSAVANLGLVKVGFNGTGNATINLDGGTFKATQIVRTNAGTGTFNFNGGTLQANTGAVTDFLTGLSVANIRNGGAIIDTNGQSISLAKALTHSDIGGDNATDGGLTKIGSGTLTLSASNSYTGATTVSNGTLALGASDVIPNTSAVSINGGVLDLGANNETIGVLGLASGSVTGTGTLSPSAVTANIASGTFTVSAPIGGTGNLAKSGAGTLTLSGSNTYGGITTVTGGTLALGSSGSLSSLSSLGIQTGAILDLRNGVGNRSQTVDNLTLDNATLLVGLGGTSTDSLSVGDTTSVTGTNTIKLYGSVNAGAYTLINGSAPFSGTINLDTSALVTGFTSYSGNIVGDDYVLTVGGTPAPATAYWLGGVSGIWGDASAAPTSNWASNAGGSTNAGQIPAAVSDVVFSATGAGNTATTLGTDFSVKSLTFGSGPASVGGANLLSIVGTNTSGHALEVLSGAGVSLAASSVTFAGSAAIRAGGTLGVADGNLGDATGSLLVDGTLNVNGAIIKGDLTGSGSVGGSGTLMVGTASGTTFSGAFINSVGLAKAGSGTLSLTGASTGSGPVTVSAGTLSVGNGGTSGSLGSGAVSLAGGTTLALNRSNSSTLGASLSGSGTLSHVGTGVTTFTGADTRTGAISLAAGTLVNAGSFSGSTLSVTNGTLNNTTGSFSTPASASIGLGGGSSGTLSVGGGTVAVTGMLTIGADSGSGVYSQSGGSVTTTGNLALANGTTGASATATISGGTLAPGGEFWIGNGSGNSATATMAGGAITAGSWMSIGRQTGTGTLGISGGTLTKTGGGALLVGDGDGATGTLNLSGTGTLTCTSEIWISQGSTSNGLLNMTGGTLNISNWLAVGRNAGNGTLNISGGTLNHTGTTTYIALGAGGGADGSVGTLNHSGGTLNHTLHKIQIGDVGAGVGFYNVSGTAIGNFALVSVGDNPTGTGTVNLDGGTLNATQVAKNATATGTFNFNGGTLRAGAGAATDFMTGLSAANVRNGGAVLDTNGQDVTVAQVLQHSVLGGDAATDGGLTKNGAGTLTLDGANTHTGATTVNAGTLRLGNPNALGAGSVAVTGGSLDLNGQTAANTASLGASGTLTGSGSLGAATISGSVTPGGTASGLITLASATVASTASISLQLGGIGTRGTDYDALTVGSALALDGTITVSLNGLVPAAGQSFDLIDSTGAIDVTNFTVATDLVLPALGGGLAWNTSAFATSGVVSIVNGDPVTAYVSGPPYNLTGNDALPGADPDGDGISNALEYAFGTSPISNNGPEYRGVASTTSGALSLTYRRPLNGVSGVTYGVEFKTADLVVGNTGWTTGVLNTHYTQSVTPNGDGTTETVVINLTGAVSGKKFARVLVTY